jgi:hypothetical protein
MRRELGTLEEAETITAAERLRAISLYRQMTPAVAGDDLPAAEDVAAEAAAAAEAAERAAEAEARSVEAAVVTPIDVRKRGEGPSRT